MESVFASLRARGEIDRLYFLLRPDFHAEAANREVWSREYKPINTRERSDESDATSDLVRTIFGITFFYIFIEVCTNRQHILVAIQVVTDHFSCCTRDHPRCPQACYCLGQTGVVDFVLDV